MGEIKIMEKIQISEFSNCKTIEQLSISLVNAYNDNNKITFQTCCRSLVKEIKSDTYQFKSLEHYYIVSRALFYVLNEIGANDRNYNSICYVLYYTLLKCICIRGNRDYDTYKFEKKASSKLAFLLLIKNNQFILNEILVPRFNSIEISSTQFKWQLMVFYLNDIQSNVNVIIDERIEKLYKQVLSLAESIRIQARQLYDHRKDIVEFVNETMNDLIKSIEITFDINDEFDLL